MAIEGDRRPFSQAAQHRFWAGFVFGSAFMFLLFLFGYVLRERLFKPHAWERPPKPMADQFVTFMKEGRIEDALSLTSSEFQQVVGIHELGLFNYDMHHGLDEPVGELSLPGKRRAVSSSSESQIFIYSPVEVGGKELEVTVVREGGVWRIEQLRMSYTFGSVLPPPSEPWQNLCQWSSVRLRRTGAE
jgi:hypothetical protein